MPAPPFPRLIVEDDPQVRELYRAVLTMEGFTIDLVADGLDALRRLDEGAPDLVVLDLALPRLSGHAVYEEIAADARMRHIPIVVATADPGNLIESENLCILRKPIDPDILLATVRRCLAKRAGQPRQPF